LILRELKQGMRLVRGVVSPQGALLARPGEELTEKHLRLFKMWGVADAEIMDTTPREAEASDLKPRTFDSPGDEIDFIFDHELDDAVMYRIAGLAKDLVAQRGRAR
ncbi:MAG: hypothetical protein ACRDF8_00540, partial [Chloroflexota bacterium]